MPRGSRIDNPTPRSEGYTLDLYCRFEHSWKEPERGDGRATYTDELGSVCRTEAQRDGWILHKDGSSTCPACNPRRKPRAQAR